MKSFVHVFIQSCICLVCDILDFVLFFPANIIILMHLIAQILAITTFLYRIDNSRDFWHSYLMLNFASAVTCAVLGFVFYIITDYVAFYKKPFKMLQIKIKACDVLHNVIGIICFVSALAAMIMWGDTGSQLFAGDSWWVFVGRGLFVTGSIWLISRVLLQMGYENVLKNCKE